MVLSAQRPKGTRRILHLEDYLAQGGRSHGTPKSTATSPTIRHRPRRLRSARLAQEAEGTSDGRLENLSHMKIPKRQEQSAEERIGTMVGKIMVLALIALLVWGYASTLAARFGLF
jgi:hypothetical protein